MFGAIHFNEVAVNMTDYIQPYPHQSSTRRHEQQYLIPHCNTDVHKKSFFVTIAKLWNILSCDCSLLVGPPKELDGRRVNKAQSANQNT